MRRIPLLALLVVASPGRAAAEDLEGPRSARGVLDAIDADQDAKTELLRLIGAPSPAAFPRLKSAMPVQERRGFAGARALLAGQTQMRDYLSSSPSLRRMTELLRSPQADLIQAELRSALEIDAQALARERDAMLPQADRLDAEDSRLGVEARALNERKIALDGRRSDLERRQYEYNSACAAPSTPQTRQWCVENRPRIIADFETFNRDIEVYNADAGRHLDASTGLDAQWAAFLKLIEDLEARAKRLIERIEKALAVRRRTCSDEEHEHLQDSVNASCKRESRACTEQQDCDTLRANLRKNQACYDARVAIADRCYGGLAGSDSGHRQQVRDTLAAIDKCIGTIAKQCGSGIGAASWE